MGRFFFKKLFSGLLRYYPNVAAYQFWENQMGTLAHRNIISLTLDGHTQRGQSDRQTRNFYCSFWVLEFQNVQKKKFWLNLKKKFFLNCSNICPSGLRTYKKFGETLWIVRLAAWMWTAPSQQTTIPDGALMIGCVKTPFSDDLVTEITAPWAL